MDNLTTRLLGGGLLPEDKFCRECGTATGGAKFCPECGTATGQVAPATPATPATPTTPAMPAMPAMPEAEQEREIWSGRPDPVLSPLAAKTTSYVVTNERVRVVTGVIGKKAEQVELFRVKDIRVKKSLQQRTRHRGDLLIVSTDPTAPELTFESIKDPDETAETVRGLVQAARARQGIRQTEWM